MKKEEKISEFINFLFQLSKNLDLNLSLEKFKKNIKNEYEVAAKVLNEISRFFYQKNKKLKKDYISEFHKYWKENHEKILAPGIDNKMCKKLAEVLETIYKENKVRVQLDTLDLTSEEIANVRFFTAIQDFKIDISVKINPFEIYKRKPECFEAGKIINNELLVDSLLREIGADSQRDKRETWMLRAAKLLNEKYSGSAYNINKIHKGDVMEIKKVLIEKGFGFSEKKVDMFLRDMVDLGVWEYKNPENINVMSDKNTMRIALRTGILKFRIPLLVSYLDVYCYQYSLVDKWNTKAWRKVWEVWASIKNNHRPPSPASIDYLIYRMGKKACWKAPLKRKCSPNKPASFNWIQSLDKQDRLIFGKDNYCIFNKVCLLQNKILNHPMSISIYGATGWQSGVTNEGGGGGIQS